METFNFLNVPIDKARLNSLSKRDQQHYIHFLYKKEIRQKIHDCRASIFGSLERINYDHQSRATHNIQSNQMQHSEQTPNVNHQKGANEQEPIGQGSNREDIIRQGSNEQNFLHNEVPLFQNPAIIQHIDEFLLHIIQIYNSFHALFQSIRFDSVLSCLLQDDPLLSSFIENRVVIYFVERRTDLLKTLRLAGVPFEKRIVLFINEKIVEKCSSQNDESLTVLLQWLDSNVLSLLQEIGFNLPIWKSRLQQYLYKELSIKLINNLFNIVVDFPETMEQILDLKECLIHTGMHDELVHSLRLANRKRLLHLGAHTNDIIIQYTNIIKAFNLLDPTGVSLNRISCDINQFLRNRKDAIRYFVNSIVDEENDLFEELMDVNTGNIQDDDESDIFDPTATTNLHTITSISNTDVEFGSKPFVEHFWVPKSIYPDPSKQQTKKPSIINIFVNIFENIDLFVNEYQNILCQQLLKNIGFDTTNPSKILELLKIRFGENSLQKCEIMLKDVVDSHRLYKNIYSKLQIPQSLSPHYTAHKITSPLEGQISFSAKIISKFYWPTLPEENCVLHPMFQSLMEQYEKLYSHLKSPRHLCWLPSIGTVQFDIEIGGYIVELSATPIDASILLYLSEYFKLSIQQTSQLMKASADFIEKRLKVWVLRGVVQKTQDHLYSIVEKLEENFDPDMEVDEEAELKDDENEVDENIDDFVRGILGHFKKASIDTIHHLLTISIDSFDKTVPQLQKYLCTRNEIFEFDASSREFIIINPSQN